jgi:hypothetical protein
MIILYWKPIRFIFGKLLIEVYLAIGTRVHFALGFHRSLLALKTGLVVKDQIGNRVRNVFNFVETICTGKLTDSTDAVLDATMAKSVTAFEHHSLGLNSIK